MSWCFLFPNSFLSVSPSIDSPRQDLKDMNVEERALYLVHLLKTCARHTEDGQFKKASAGLECIASVAAPDGDPMQRLATYFLDGLAYRLVKNIRGVPEALNLSNPLSTLAQQYARKLFFEFCPFLKFSYLISNQTIVEAMEGEQVIHIIDLNACDAGQWISLLHSLKEQRQGSPLPYVKITGIHENKGVLEQMRIQLIEESEKMSIPLDFYPIESQLEKLCFDKLPVKPGELLAVSSVLQLHSLLAVEDQISPDSVLPPNPSQFDSPKMRWFLSSLWKLKPRLMVITEQESDNNGPSVTDRLDKALNFYAALFHCLEGNVPKARAIERIMMERMLLGEEIKNIITCDGVDRKERHGKFSNTWHPWLKLAGFKRVPLHYERMLQVTRPLQSYGRGYKLLENNQCLLTCWNDLPLYSISAWRF
ncbi:GRAS family protein TF80-like [Prosopis cineraria]|uniref:GRAS family protein TF80-like n=1 Tax=Prosopis cineraria TaxID=364024 RepID=UPI002410A8D6|nr:GRAS family protein TF80-like [Prosopis cineraria]